MFVVGRLAPQPAPQVLAALDDIETATIGHVREAGFLDPAIRPLDPTRRLCGSALTVSIPGDDGTALAHALSIARPGDVIVVERCGDVRHACWGAITTASAASIGVIGVVIDGFVTDIAAIRRADFPVWCRGTSPITTKMRGTSGSIGRPVACGGVVVRTGDVVLADESGVLVLDPAEVGPLAAQARAMQAAEPAIIARLAAGEKLGDINGASALVAGKILTPD